MVQIPVNWFVRTGSIVQCDKICDKLLHLRSCRNHVQDAVPDEQRSVLNNHVRKAKIKIFKNYNFSDFVELDSDFDQAFLAKWYDMEPYHTVDTIWDHAIWVHIIWVGFSFGCSARYFHSHYRSILTIFCKQRFVKAYSVTHHWAFLQRPNNRLEQ